MTKTGSGQWCSVARIAGGLLAGLLAARVSAAQKVWTGGDASVDRYIRDRSARGRLASRFTVWG